jgi:hypothetical protein
MTPLAVTASRSSAELECSGLAYAGDSVAATVTVTAVAVANRPRRQIGLDCLIGPLLRHAARLRRAVTVIDQNRLPSSIEGWSA